MDGDRGIVCLEAQAERLLRQRMRLLGDAVGRRFNTAPALGRGCVGNVGALRQHGMHGREFGLERFDAGVGTRVGMRLRDDRNRYAPGFRLLGPDMQNFGFQRVDIDELRRHREPAHHDRGADTHDGNA
ncbi:MAG: hypothetical protein H6891_02330 [Brucellaceae bacterium]|nr:hypothetical protein [Brucellaceae bacterium]